MKGLERNPLSGEAGAAMALMASALSFSLMVVCVKKVGGACRWRKWCWPGPW